MAIRTVIAKTSLYSRTPMAVFLRASYVHLPSSSVGVNRVAETKSTKN